MKTLNEAMHNLKEERYYYGEMERVKDLINTAADYLKEAASVLQDNMADTDNAYSKEQFEVFKEVDINLANMFNDCEQVHNKIAKACPNRIRSLTPEEKAEIERMKERGEI